MILIVHKQIGISGTAEGAVCARRRLVDPVMFIQIKLVLELLGARDGKPAAFQKNTILNVLEVFKEKINLKRNLAENGKKPIVSLKVNNAGFVFPQMENPLFGKRW